MTINSLKDFNQYLTLFEPKIKKTGGRSFQSSTASATLNDFVKILKKLAEEENNPEQKKIALKRIKKLNKQANDKLQNENSFVKLMTKVKQFFGNFFYSREKELNKILFEGKDLATSRSSFRVIKLEGEKGTVACRVRGISRKTFPRISPAGNVELSYRAIARMKNLIAVRGVKNARMVGPCDYYGNLEKPHKYQYTIEIHDGIPTFLQEKCRKQSAEERSPIPVEFISMVQANWHKGTNNDIEKIKEKYSNQGITAIGKSLFPNSGILEISGNPRITLKEFNAEDYDLSAFKARLVKNDAPFQITSEKLSSLDEYRAVSYFYEPNYANEQVQNAGGLFLETHSFSQTITPLDETATGFVTLGRWSEDEANHLELIGVKIPFGYTLIVDKYCIHGDTNLSGMYMMCMTSNHVTMQTADTVFLKSTVNQKNIEILIEDSPSPVAPKDKPLLKPIVTFND